MIIPLSKFTKKYINLQKEQEERRQNKMNIETAKKKRGKLVGDVKLITACITEKWLPIWTGTGVDKASRNCPLCTAYPSEGSAVCQDCPIYDDTGCTQCHHTPYEDDWKKVAGFGKTGDTSVRKEAALKEILYLQSLAMELSRRIEILSRDIEAAEREAEDQRKREEEEKARAQKARCFPYAFSVVLESNPSDMGFESRIRVSKALDLAFLAEGVKVRTIGYNYGGNVTRFNKERGEWIVSDIPMIEE